MSFLAELKRRNVIRMAGLYLVGAWLVVQVAETLLPAFGIPDWVLRAIIIVFALGFLPALAFAWVFELTPDGLRRDGGVDPNASIAPQTGRRMDRMLLVVMALALGYFAVDKFVLAPGRTPQIAAVAESPASPETTASVDSIAVESEPAPVSASSIAVLPFANMSTDEENGFFADGISEELLNVLARIDGLTVASRTSSFTFKGKDTPIPEIARLLGVQNVLEGSVRKQGNRVRITAQLIQAGTDTHLWSQTYDRELTDIFQVQEEIAQAISDELVGLLPVADKVSVPTATGDMDAYQRFLRGRTRFFQRTELEEARDDLEYAVKRDPAFGEAWVYLAATHYVLPGYVGSLDEEANAAALTSTLAKAEQLQPDHPLVQAIQGTLQFERGDTINGLDAQARAAALPSADSTPKLWYGSSLLVAGYADQAVTALEQALAVDPLSGINHGYLGTALLMRGDETRGAVEVALAASQGWTYGQSVYGYKLVARGERARGLALIEEFAAVQGPEAMARLKAFEAATEEGADKRDYLTQFDPAAFDESLLGAGLFDVVLDRWLARDKSKPGFGVSRLILNSLWQPEYVEAQNNPKFLRRLESIGLVALWEARGYPPGCTRVADPAGDHLACEGTTR